MVLPFLALYLTQVRGLTAVQAGQLLSLYGIGSILGSLIGGRLADSLGPLRAQQVSLLAGGCAFLVLSRIESHIGLAVGILLTSLVVDSFRPACMTAFSERAPKGSEMRAFALLRLASNLGVGIAPAVGGLLAVRSYALLFVADAATCWIAACILATPLLKQGSVARARSSPTHPVPAMSPWRDRPFVLFLLLMVGVMVVLAQSFTTFSVYLRDSLGYREDLIGFVFSLNPVLIVIFEMLVVQRIEKLNPFLVLGIGCLLLCGGFALMPLHPSPGFIAFTVVIWTIGEMFTLPVANTLAAERAHPEQRGAYLGLFSTAFSSGFVIAPPLGLWLYQRLGGSGLWTMVGMAGIPLAIVSFSLSRWFTSGPSRSVEPAEPPIA